MILQSFLLGNLVSLCKKIINSVVVVGLYYGFLTTFSIGPSYFFLLRTQVMEEGEEGTAKRVAATTGFIMGQLIMFISIYYTPLYLALGRPHTITVLALPYLLFQFFWNNHKHFFDYESTSRNSMRNLSIPCVFLNNLIFQLFNYFILPSAMLARLVNIYMFRCNNKMLFVTSSFFGWLMGHILFMKGAELVLVWIQQNHSIRSNKYLLSELRNSIARIFSILLFISCVYYLGRMPSPIFTKKLKETPETKESEEETDVEIEKTSETEETKQQEEGCIEEDPSPSLFSEEKEDPDKETEKIRVNGKDKTKDEFHLYLEEASYQNSSTSYSGNKKNSDHGYNAEQDENDHSDDEEDDRDLERLKDKKKTLWFEKHPLVLLFDYKRWNRPTRYIKNNRFERAVRNEMSQYFFYPCQNDGKQRISFTYPPSFSIFWEMIQRNISLPTPKKFNLDDELYNYWISTNKKKKNNLSNEFFNRITILDKGFFYIDVLDKKTQLCNDKTKKEYLPETHDPLLNGSYRGIIKEKDSPFINIPETTIKNGVDEIVINKIHSDLDNDSNYEEFEHKKDTFKSISPKIKHFVTLMSQGEFSFNQKNISLLSEQEQIGSENQEIFLKLLVDTMITDSFTQTIQKKDIGIKEISKEVSRWSYKLIDDLEQFKRQMEKNVLVEHQIRSRKAKRVVIYTDKQENTDNPSPNTVDNSKQPGEIALIRYSQQSDFRRDIIKGSMRVQRRKIAIWKFFQANIHSPLFLDRIDKSYLVNFSRLIKRILKNWMGKNSEFQSSDYKELEEKTKRIKNQIEEEKIKEQTRIDIAEAWDTIPFAQIIRGLMLITQSILRKYILLPLLIIAKNSGRILLFQPPEWTEDFNDWNNEMHVKCTYNGVQLSETEFPKNWLTDGIQIKILYPFCLKPWHKSMIRPSYRDLIKEKEENENFSFLTVCGTETDVLFGPPRKHPPFFQPIFKQLNKKIRKFRKTRFEVLKIIKEKIEFFLKSSNEKKNWIMEIILFLKKKRKKMPTINPILVVVSREESSKRKKEKNSIINNDMIHESSIQTRFLNWTNSSVTEKKRKDLANRTRIIKNQIEKIAKDNIKINSSPNKIDSVTKRFESPQNMGQILKRKNARLICKSNYILKFFRERIYIDIFLYIINLTRINTQLFLESTKNWIDKSISNRETNDEKIDKTNINIIQFISTIKKEFLPFLNSNNSNINKNSKIFSDFSFFSQAHVFYQLSQDQIFNLKSVLQYPGISLFLKNEIKKDFVTQGIAHSQLQTQKIPNSGINQWKNWLKSKSNYHYDLPQLKWSQLVPQKWRNTVTEHCFVENKNLQQNKRNLYQKKQLINYKNTNNSETDLLPDPKFNFTKNYRYDVLSSKFVYYEDMNDSYRCSYGIPVEVNKNKEFSYIDNYNINKDKLIGMWWNIPIRNYLGIKNIMDIEKNTDRKYLDLKIIHFCLRKKIDIEAWVNISTSMNENTKTESKNYQIVDKIDKKDLSYHTIYQEINRSHQKKKLFDWMGMNEEILSRPISKLESWFFSEFFLFYNEYKMKPWVIPMDFLFSNSNISENLSENQNINRKKKTNTFIPSNEKNAFEFELKNGNQDENDIVVIPLDPESNVQNGSESILSNRQKDIEENSIGSDMTIPRKRQKPKSTKILGLDFLLKKYLLFQLRWGESLNQKLINNIKVYCLQLRLINPTEITISSLERKELSMDIMLPKKDLTLRDLLKKGILIVEPIRLSVKDDELFILYQTIGISLVHKSKHQNNQKIYSENLDKKNWDLLAPENILSPRRCRELRILICLNSRNNNGVNTKQIGNRVKNYSEFFDENKDLDQDKNTLRKFKFFLWPNYRLEDLACMNRYWFDTNNGSRFSILRLHMYPQLKIHL
uniref:Protein TIC 214 n=1 Tax=Sclerolaena napiformis TaxID=2902184 RepID=A0A8K1WI75_9CARY|nr:putative chloroplast RF19 [Sclerolaena napiformis]